jgi:hypothetical protein
MDKVRLIRITSFISLWVSAVWFGIVFVFAFWNVGGVACINVNMFDEKYLELPLVLYGLVFGTWFLLIDLKEEIKQIKELKEED